MAAKKLQKPEYHGPTRTFYSNYQLLPPYKILKDQNNHYSLKKTSDYQTVDTSSNFWKPKLYWMRLKTWTINCIVFLAFSVWKGPLGVRCLWGIEDFNTETNINYQTGELYYGTQRTVIGSFKKVLNGIQRSRNQFEEAPDLGLLGKNVSRNFNYLECYVFRFLFVGILIVLICYPILIVFVSTITFILVVTFWAWMPVILIATYLYNIFVKQFESAYVEHGCFSRSFPLFSIVGVFIGSIGIVLLSVLNLIILSPIRTFGTFSYCVIAQLFRRTLDKIMMTIFKHLGRTPSRNTMIAKKISGPGMSKDFYMSINEEDVYILMRSHLERKFMGKLNELITKKINLQGQSANSVINLVLRPFGVHYNLHNEVQQNKNELFQNYQKQFQHYMKRFPNNPQNVRFTQEEIDNYFPNTVNIVKSYLDRSEIGPWIFDNFELY